MWQSLLLLLQSVLILCKLSFAVVGLKKSPLPFFIEISFHLQQKSRKLVVRCFISCTCKYEGEELYLVQYNGPSKVASFGSWKRDVPAKGRMTNGLHGVVFPKIELVITTAVRTSRPTNMRMFNPNAKTNYYKA